MRWASHSNGNGFVHSVKHYKNNQLDWSKMNVKKHFPISNRHCVSFVPKKDKSKIGTSEIAYSIYMASKSDVQTINLLSFAQKERYAYCSQRETLEDASNPPAEYHQE